MRQTHTRQSRPKRKEESGHFSERTGRRSERTRPGFEEENYRDDWDYGEEDYRSENPYAEEKESGEEEYSEENEREERPYKETREQPYRSSRSGAIAAGNRRSRVSHESKTYETERPRRNYRSANGRRGFVAMPRSEVRRIAAKGSNASHNGGRTTERKRTPAGGGNRRTRTRARGFAAMPASEVRRIAAMGGRASHGGGRPATRSARSRKVSRARRG